MNQDDESPIMGKLAAPLPDVPDEPEQTKSTSALRSRVGVLSILFLVTGALGIPLLWVSPNFTKGERIFWTIAVLVYTIALLAGTCAAVWWGYNRLIGSRGF